MELSSHSFVAMVLAGGVATYIWRFAGASLVQSLSPDGDLMLWVRAVAIAIVAALCTKIAIAPPDIVAEASLLSRIASMAAGVIGFYATRQTGLGVVAAVITLIGVEVLT